jgi:hypothetical protein
MAIRHRANGNRNSDNPMQEGRRFAQKYYKHTIAIAAAAALSNGYLWSTTNEAKLGHLSRRNEILRVSQKHGDAHKKMVKEMGEIGSEKEEKISQLGTKMADRMMKGAKPEDLRAEIRSELKEIDAGPIAAEGNAERVAQDIEEYAKTLKKVTELIDEDAKSKEISGHQGINTGLIGVTTFVMVFAILAGAEKLFLLGRSRRIRQEMERNAEEQRRQKSKKIAQRRQRKEAAREAARLEAIAADKKRAPARSTPYQKEVEEVQLSKREVLRRISENLGALIGECDAERASKQLLKSLGREVCAQIALQPGKAKEIIEANAGEEDSGVWRILDRINAGDDGFELDVELDMDRNTPVPTFRPHEMMVFPADLEKYVIEKGLNPESLKAAIVYGFNLHTNKKKARGATYLPIYRIRSNIVRAVSGITENPEVAADEIIDFLHKEGVMGYYKKGTTAMFDPEIGQSFPKTENGIKLINAVDKWAFEFKKMQAPN